MSRKEFHWDIFNNSDTSSEINDVVLKTLSQKDIDHIGDGQHDTSSVSTDLLKASKILKVLNMYDSSNDWRMTKEVYKYQMVQKLY